MISENTNKVMKRKLKRKVGILINQVIYDVMQIKRRKEERGKGEGYIML